MGAPMEISVRFFALYRERAGCRETTVSVSSNATVADLLVAVRERFPHLAPPEVQIVVAVNEEYAEPELALHPRDDICLIPPVSGGLFTPGGQSGGQY
ncbi:MAG: molybdopterin converting factor subunit 1 [Chloroflexi bacterium]|nr:molybdopterin converting factor subunit 1 [Chloroflexota bacterium]